MYGIFTHIWLMFMVNVGKCTIRGAYGCIDIYIYAYMHICIYIYMHTLIFPIFKSNSFYDVLVRITLTSKFLIHPN